jgi:hypothetical protein
VRYFAAASDAAKVSRFRLGPSSEGQKERDAVRVSFLALKNDFAISGFADCRARPEQARH